MHLEPTLMCYILILSRLSSYFQIRSYSQVLEFRTSTYLLGNTVQLTTAWKGTKTIMKATLWRHRTTVHSKGLDLIQRLENFLLPHKLQPATEVAVDYSWESCKRQTLWGTAQNERPRPRRNTKTRSLEEFNASGTHRDNKHQTQPNLWADWYSHSKVLLTSVSTALYMSIFQQQEQNYKCTKRQEITRETKHCQNQRHMTQVLKLSIRKLKTTMINMLRILMETEKKRPDV